MTVDNVPAPTVVSAPEIAGVARRGNGLSVAPALFDEHGALSHVAVARVWQRCKADGSACTDVAGATGTTYTVGDADLNRTLRVVETATNDEGTVQTASALTSRVTREDGTLPTDNDGIDNDGDGVIDEPGETGLVPPSGGTSTVPDPTASGVQPTKNGANRASGADGATTSHTVTKVVASSAPVVNGEGASADARLTVAWSRGGATRKIAYGRSLVARGRLVDGAGRPVRGAVIDVSETAALAGAHAAAVQPAVTGDDGSFTYTAPSRGGSRTVGFAYRFRRGGDVTSEQALALVVRAGVRLSVALRGVTASYRGRVLAGAMPRGGKLVIVQGRAKGGSWQTFASRRAGRTGTFKGKYRLKVRRPGKQLQFRVRVISESGWNYAAVTSKAVTRRVR